MHSLDTAMIASGRRIASSRVASTRSIASTRGFASTRGIASGRVASSRVASAAMAFIAALAVTLVVAAQILVAPASAYAADGGDVTWTVRTGENAFGADRSSFSYTVNPGASVADSIVVTNRGDEPLDLGVYAADGFTNEAGRLDLIAGDATSRGIGAWAHADRDRLTIEPGQTAEFPFTVQVPDNATPGDYAGGIVTALTQPDDATGINVDRRLGVRISVRVTGDLQPSLQADDVQLAWTGGWVPFAGGDATLNYTLRNTGNTIITATQEATLTGPFGWFPSSVPEIDDSPQLLPGESWAVSVPVSDVAPWVWLTGTATVTPLTLDASGSTDALQPVVARTGTVALPWTLLIVVVAVVGIVVLYLRRRKATAAAQASHTEARVQEAVATALAERSALDGRRPGNDD